MSRIPSAWPGEVTSLNDGTLRPVGWTWSADKYFSEEIGCAMPAVVNGGSDITGAGKRFGTYLSC